MAASAQFRLFGFPVHVRVGFVIFIVLVWTINNSEDSRIGLYLAGLMAAFTLLHELGHAVAARAAGARAEIVLDFLYGYAAFVPSRPLRRWERAGISFAGPGVQIAAGSLLVIAADGNPLSYRSVVDAGDLAFALWWAGPLIGMFNLIPVLPFDGGNITHMLVDKVVPRHSQLVMIIFSLAFTIGGVIVVLTIDEGRWSPFAIYAAFPLLNQFQIVQQYRAQRATSKIADTRRELRNRELAVWNGTAPPESLGAPPSPWLLAHLHLRRGAPNAAAAALGASFAADAGTEWLAPTDVAPGQLAQLVALLPRPLPIGNAFAECVLGEVLLKLGEYNEAATYAADGHRRHHHPRCAVIVSRAAAALGDNTVATGWLRAALGSSAFDQQTLLAIAHADEFDRLRATSEFRDALTDSR